MKTTSTIIGLLLSVGSILAQTPKLYIHIVSHNEPTDSLDKLPGTKYFNAKSNALQMASIIDSKNAKWNLQTSDGFVIGALNYDAAGTSSTDIFEILANPPYDDNIEIDPRSKNKGGRNIADQWYLLDSCGANPTMTLGGFIWAVCPPASSTSIDWFQYRNPIIGNIYGNSWQCEILSGAGSLTPHCNDLNDFGIFKPISTTNFYTHDSNPTNNLWCIGVGCAPLLDSLSDEQNIIDLIQGQVDSIQNGLWPANKFYVTRIMTNQREYGPLFFQKISKVIDSLNLIPSSKLQWATIGETFTAFQAWQTTSGLDHSQWLCGQTTTGVDNLEANNKFSIYPNPLTNMVSIDFTDNQAHRIEVVDYLGSILYSSIINASTTIDLSKFSNGIYLIHIDGITEKIIKN
jgi:hypothetical protein